MDMRILAGYRYNINLKSTLELKTVWRLLLAFGAGAATVSAFAPFSLYPLAILGPLLLFLLWLNSTPLQAFREGWFFGLGLLGFGVFWLRISIDQFGNLGTLTAILITLAFITIIATYYGLVGWFAVRFSARIQQQLILFSSFWVFFEWIRGWFLTGFPWLALGYSQIDSPLGALAPLIGVYGVSLAVTTSSALLVWCLQGSIRQLLVASGGLILIWGMGYLLQGHQWTHPAGEPIRVSMIQGNVAQHLKWKKDSFVPTLELYARLTRDNWQSDLIIWPETAVPAFAHQVERSFLQPMEEQAMKHKRVLLIGIPIWQQEENRYFNAMLVLGEDTPTGERQAYYKRHLVPFGEFMPLQSLLRPLIDWLQIPMSDFSAGESTKPLLQMAGYAAGISICYEDAFGEEVIEALPEAAFLINASNDAWFGDSLAPHQHLEIARMRALESGRYLLRSTNTGISALISADGEIVKRSPAFQQHVLSGDIIPLTGLTPYARFGNWLTISVISIVLLVLILVNRRN